MSLIQAIVGQLLISFCTPDAACVCVVQVVAVSTMRCLGPATSEDLLLTKCGRCHTVRACVVQVVESCGAQHHAMPGCLNWGGCGEHAATGRGETQGIWSHAESVTAIQPSGQLSIPQGGFGGGGGLGQAVRWSEPVEGVRGFAKGHARGLALSEHLAQLYRCARSKPHCEFQDGVLCGDGDQAAPLQHAAGKY
jgi:hypothetical protein